MRERVTWWSCDGADCIFYVLRQGRAEANGLFKNDIVALYGGQGVSQSGKPLAEIFDALVVRAAEAQQDGVKGWSPRGNEQRGAGCISTLPVLVLLQRQKAFEAIQAGAAAAVLCQTVSRETSEVDYRNQTQS